MIHDPHHSERFRLDDTLFRVVDGAMIMVHTPTRVRLAIKW